MRLTRVLFETRGLVFVTVVTAVLLGGSILLLREFAPIRTPAPTRANTGSVIMEGVDIKSNGPGHVRPGPSPGGEPRFPPDLQTGAAP
jgi:hypothetical protein